MKKQSVVKMVKIVGVILLLGVGAYFGVDTSKFIQYLNSIPDEQSQVESDVSLPVVPSLVDAGQ